MSRHIILAGRGVGAPTAERTLGDLAGRLGQRLGVPVLTALLDHGEQSIHAALDRARSDGADEVLVLPAELPRNRYLETWARKAVAHWTEQAERTGGSVPAVRFGVGVSEVDEVIGALVAAAAAPSRPVTESPESFRSPSWSEITAHRRHVFVCRGPRCSAHGAGPVAKALDTGLRRRGHEDDSVLVTQTGCLIPCNLGPIIVVHPDDVWYTGVDPAAVRRIVDDHLCDGTIVDELRTLRSASGKDDVSAAPSGLPQQPATSIPEGL